MSYLKELTPMLKSLFILIVWDEEVKEKLG